MCRLWVRSGAGEGEALEELAPKPAKAGREPEEAQAEEGGARGLSRQSHEGSPQQNAPWRSDRTRLTFQKNHLALDLNIEYWDKGRI